MNEFDVVVIGSGPGGYVCAIRCAQLGLKTAIVEKKSLGGVCLNVGCIPTKSLLKNAELAHLLKDHAKDFGIGFEKLTLDYSVAVKRSRQVADRLSRGVGFLMKKNNITVFMGNARLTARDTVLVMNGAPKAEELKAKNIVVATGSHASAIPGVNVDGQKIITYLEAILQEKLPASAIIIGAGALGLEFASIWNVYGIKVTVIEMLPRVAPTEDEEISNELAKSLSKRGIQLLTGSKVLSVKANGSGVKAKISTTDGEQEIEAEQMLVAAGFKPNTGDLGLEDLGVKLTERKYIDVNEHMASNIPGIWAIGDVTGKLLLAHVATAQALLCAESIAGMDTQPLDYTMIPRAIYSMPQVASFGYTEAQAKEKGLLVKIGKFNFQANGKALGLGDYAGFAKLIVGEKQGEILGAHLIGPEVCELLPEISLAQANELTIENIARNIHAHPTLSEVIMDAAHAAMGQSIQA